MAVPAGRAVTGGVRTWLLIIASCLLAGTCAAWLTGVGTPGTMNLVRPFNSAGWKAADGQDKVRCAMVADLRHRIGLDGRTEAEVVRLLGAPAYREGALTTYPLCPSFIDLYILELEWSDGVVVSTRVRDT